MPSLSSSHPAPVIGRGGGIAGATVAAAVTPTIGLYRHWSSGSGRTPPKSVTLGYGSPHPLARPRDEMQMATLLSVNVGLPKNVSWQSRTVYTGIWKRRIDGPHLVRRLNIDGDGQGDLNGHGGEQRAVLVYQLDSYRHWEQHFGRPLPEHGQFGRTSPSTASATTRCASATGTSSGTQSSRSPNRESPASGWACG